MKTIKPYLSALFAKNKREDERKLFDYRPISVEVNPIKRANGSARVRIGETEVLVGVKFDVGTPFPDTPDEGVMIVNAELIPLASPKFEPGPPRENAVELARVVDRGIRESKAIDFAKLCITPREKVWMVFIDVYPMNDDGNLFDAAALGAMVALKNAVLPKYDVENDIIDYKELTKEKLPLKKIPILNTIAKINGSLFIDATARERDVIDARLSLSTLENGNIAAMQKGGTGTFTAKEIIEIVDHAIEKGKELRKFVK